MTLPRLENLLVGLRSIWPTLTKDETHARLTDAFEAFSRRSVGSPRFIDETVLQAAEATSDIPKRYVVITYDATSADLLTLSTSDVEDTLARAAVNLLNPVLLLDLDAPDPVTSAARNVPVDSTKEFGENTITRAVFDALRSRFEERGIPAVDVLRHFRDIDAYDTLIAPALNKMADDVSDALLVR